MFMEHSHDIFPEYLEKVHKEILGNIPKNVPRILNIEYTLNVPWISHECYMRFFQVDQEIQ